MVADQIRDLIISGELEEGERLPRVEVLQERFGVSAPSMREALRILESDGLVTVQRGGVGGAVVHRPTHETAAYTLALVMAGQGADIGDLRGALGVLEPGCAMMCAKRSDRNRTVVKELSRLNTKAREEIDDVIPFGETMTAFHAALVRHCGNSTLTLVAGALESIFIAHLRGKLSSPKAEQATRREDRLAELTTHEQLTDLIAAGEATKVFELMTGHLTARRLYINQGAAKEQIDINTLRARPG
jgi:DNA-binding FadR family transcriptional regulator